MTARQWYHVEAKADTGVADLFIYDEIGKSFWNDDAVSSKNFIDDLNGLAPAIAKAVVHVNSPGGDVFEAVAIANALRIWGQAKGRTVETCIEGIAASAASIVIMAGSTIRIADNAIVMVHHPWTIEIGNAAEMRKTADVLDKLTDSIVATYKWQSKLTDEALIALMDAETWMDADEAIANGFATEKVEGLKAAASISQASVAKLTIPTQFKARVDALLKKEDPPPPAPVAAAASDVLGLVSAAGLDIAFASSLVSAGLTVDQVTAKIATAKAEKTARETRASEIRALCVSQKQPELADGYIAGAMSPADVRAHLTVITAKLDKAEIDTGLPPGGGAVKPAVTVADAYAKLNRPA